MSNEELIKKIDEECSLATEDDNFSMEVSAYLSIAAILLLSAIIIYEIHNLFKFYLAI